MHTMQSLLVGLLVLVAVSADVTVNPLNNCQLANANCQISNVYWPSATVGIMVTNDNKVWRSTTEGYNWTRILTGVNRIAAATEANSSVIYFLASFNTGLNYSLDGGQTIYPAVLPAPSKQIYEFNPHPTTPGWVMATGCTDPAVGQVCTLYTSQDYGKTWKSSFAGYIENGLAEWGNSTSAPGLIFIQKNGAGSDPWSYGYTTDFGNSYNVIFADTFGFVITEHYQFVAANGPGGYINLYASSYRSDPTHKSRSSYKVANFPFGENLLENYYAFLDDSTRSEFLGVQLHRPTEGTSRPYGTVFTSEFDGAFYQKSLDYVYQVNNGYDFHRFRGLGGIYFANTLLDWTVVPLQRTTMITFDNGGEWRYLTPPLVDMDGNPYPNCTAADQCALHLAGPIEHDEYGAEEWLTHSHAIGMAVANGNVGHYLGDGHIATYLTRDAGLTWREIWHGPTTYEFGDHGGILVLAPLGEAVNSVQFSYDYGLSFHPVQFSGTSFVWVTGIYSQWDGTGLRFFVNGADNSTKVNGIWGLDFSHDLTTQCSFPQDYEQWQPSNGLDNAGANCFMGATYTYWRRKQNVATPCYNGAALSDMEVNVTACACTWEDYECMWNFNTSGRNQTNGFKCGRVYPNTPCTPGTQYHEHPLGYTRIPDTQCQGGLDLEGPLLTCKAKSHPTEVAAAVIVSLLVVGTIVGVVVLYFKNERFRTWVKSLKKGGSGKYKEINHVGDDDDDNTPFLGH